MFQKKNKKNSHLRRQVVLLRVYFTWKYEENKFWGRGRGKRWVAFIIDSTVLAFNTRSQLSRS